MVVNIIRQQLKFNTPHVTWGKCWLFQLGVKTWLKTEELYTYPKFRDDFIWIWDTRQVRVIPRNSQWNRDGWQPLTSNNKQAMADSEQANK